MGVVASAAVTRAAWSLVKPAGVVVAQAVKRKRMGRRRKSFIFVKVNGVFLFRGFGSRGDPVKEASRCEDCADLIGKVCEKASKALDFPGYFTFCFVRYSSATVALNKGADKNTVSHLLDQENLRTFPLPFMRIAKRTSIVLLYPLRRFHLIIQLIDHPNYFAGFPVLEG